MTAEQFAYWLQGFAELNPEPPTPEQWRSVREHLQTVFVKVTPPVHVPDALRNTWPPQPNMGAGETPPTATVRTWC